MKSVYSIKRVFNTVYTLKVNKMVKYVAYYRVSTQKQGKSGLGLEAQKQIVAGFVAGKGELIAEYTEIESKVGWEGGG